MGLEKMDTTEKFNGITNEYTQKILTEVYIKLYLQNQRDCPKICVNL